MTLGQYNGVSQFVVICMYHYHHHWCHYPNEERRCSDLPGKGIFHLSLEQSPSYCHRHHKGKAEGKVSPHNHFHRHHLC